MISNEEEGSKIPLSAETLLKEFVGQHKGDVSKRAQARFLAEMGYSTVLIANSLGIRYQQAYKYTSDIRSKMSVSRCSVCGRPLSDEVHKKAGIGPVCQVKKSLEGKNFVRKRSIAG